MYPRTLLTFILLFALCLTACGEQRAVPLPPLADDAVILAFGDSLTYGSGVSAEQSYPSILQRLSGREVINAGVPGELTAEGLQRLPEVLSEHQPALLILCLGGNDMLRKGDLQKSRRNLEQMISISRNADIPVLLLGVPRPAIFGLESAEFYYSIADEMGVPLEANIIPEVLSDTALKSDQIHPNAEGYRLIAGAVLNKLKEAGAL